MKHLIFLIIFCLSVSVFGEVDWSKPPIKVPKNMIEKGVIPDFKNGGSGSGVTIPQVDAEINKFIAGYNNDGYVAIDNTDLDDLKVNGRYYCNQDGAEHKPENFGGFLDVYAVNDTTHKEIKVIQVYKTIRLVDTDQKIWMRQYYEDATPSGWGAWQDMSSGGGVTKDYVDTQDTATLSTAKTYADADTVSVCPDGIIDAHIVIADGTRGAGDKKVFKDSGQSIADLLNNISSLNFQKGGTQVNISDIPTQGDSTTAFSCAGAYTINQTLKDVDVPRCFAYYTAETPIVLPVTTERTLIPIPLAISNTSIGDWATDGNGTVIYNGDTSILFECRIRMYGSGGLGVSGSFYYTTEPDPVIYQFQPVTASTATFIGDPNWNIGCDPVFSPKGGKIQCWYESSVALNVSTIFFEISPIEIYPTRKDKKK